MTKLKNEPKKRVDIVSLQMVKEDTTLYAGRRCNSPDAMYRLFAPFIETKDREYLVMAGLNQKMEPTIIQTIHIGTINQSLAFPRDIQLTKQLEKACHFLQIKLQDHLIIGSTGNYLSLRAEGHIDDPS